MEISVPTRINKNQPVCNLEVPRNSLSVNTIDNLIKDLQRIKEHYKDKTLYWEIDLYQDEDERSIVFFDKVRQTDEEYKDYLIKSANDIEDHAKFQLKRAEAFRDYVSKLK